jgi:non-ribosomal peptide synthetase component E (peptide arylation enzyme)
VQLPNWNEFVVVYVALARIGAVLVPTMPIYRHDEVLYVLRHSGAKVSVVAGEFRGFDYPDMIAEIRASAPELQHVISVRCGDRPGLLRFSDLIAGTGGAGRQPARRAAVGRRAALHHLHLRHRVAAQGLPAHPEHDHLHRARPGR